MANEIKCLNCGSHDLTTSDVGIPVRPRMLGPGVEYKAMALICNECGFMALFGESQFKKFYPPPHS